MYKNEEEKLAAYKKTYDREPIPGKKVNDAITAGMQKAKMEKKQKPRKVKWVMGIALVAILLVGFSQGIGKIIELVQDNKGLMSAIENDYYQEIGVSKEKNGLEVVLDGVIADEHGMVLFYTLNSDEEQWSLSIGDVEIKAIDGKELDYATMSFGGYDDPSTGKSSKTGTIEVFYQKPFKTKNFQVNLSLKGEKFSIPFTLTKDIQAKETYVLNEDVTIDDQKITFLEADVYPLRVAIHVKADPDNTKKILEYEDLRLVDEKGEIWGKIMNGVTGSAGTDDEKTIYLQSNYFHEPEELYVAFNKIQAIDKEDSKVVIDTENGEILKQPDGNKLRNLKVQRGGLKLKLYTENEEFPCDLFGQIEDADGNEVSLNSTSVSSADRVEDKEGDGSGNGTDNTEMVTEYGIYTEKLISAYKSPLTAELVFYPEWIEKDVKIRIK